MAKNNVWHDDYWLLLMQIYLKKPTGVKPLYSRDMVDLSLELHITPQELRARMYQIARLETPRIEHIWQAYGKSPQRLARAVRLLRSMKGFGAANEFYEGVEVLETFEKDFRPITLPASTNPVIIPAMLIMVLNLYFQLTPSTMVSETPEVQQLARLMRLNTDDVVEILTVFQCCDSYLNRTDVVFSPLLLPCQQVWQRFAGNLKLLNNLAEELQAYFK